MENNSQPPAAPAAPAAKVAPPANQSPKTMLQSLALAGTGTGSMLGTPAPCGATMPRPVTPVGSLAFRPVLQTNPVVFGQGSSSTNQAMQGSSSTQQAVGATALAAATPGPTAQDGDALPWLMPPSASRPERRVRPKKLKTKRLPSPPPPKLPVYRPPAPPRPELLSSSSAAGNALLQPPPDTGICVSNMQADPPSPDQVTKAEEGSGSKGGGSGRGDVKMLDLNLPPVSDDEEN